MRFPTTLTFVALALVAAPVASAQRAHGAGESSLFVSPMGEAFHANAAGARGLDLWIAEVDTNHDGRISHDEFMAYANAFFALVDTNHDGALTSLKATAYYQHYAPEVVSGYAGGEPLADPTPSGQRGHNDTYTVTRDDDVNIHTTNHGHRFADRPLGAQAYGLLGDIEPIMSCDSDFDRRVTIEEWDACAERRFARLDLNHDGFITRDEIDQMRNGIGATVASP